MTSSAGLTRMIFVRHAHHDSGGRFLQHRCTGLDPRGRRQAELIAARLAAEDVSVDAVLCSRAARTQETAAAIASALGTQRDQPTCDLCEMHPGEAEGLTVAEAEERFGPNYSFVPGAEYFPDWLPGAIERLRRLADRHAGRTIIAVTHHGVVQASFAAFGLMPPAAAGAVVTDNTGITEWTRPAVVEDPRRDVWTLRRHNDIAHLTQFPH